MNVMFDPYILDEPELKVCCDLGDNVFSETIHKDKQK